MSHPYWQRGLVWGSASCKATSPCTLGTDASPQITYIKEGSNHIHLGGVTNGSGVLVVEGTRVHIEGDFNYHGLVIGIQINPSSNTSAETHGFVIRDGAKIFGAILVAPNSGTPVFYLRDSAKIYFSSQALTMVNSLCGSCLAQPARVFAWLDK